MMPETSRFVDAFQAEFGPVHVVYANEGGCEWNSPDMARVNRSVSLADLECWYVASSSVGGRDLRGRVGRRKVGDR